MDPKTDPKRYQKSLKIEFGKRERNMFQSGGQRGPKKEPKSIKIASNFDVETQADKNALFTGFAPTWNTPWRRPRG